jgi:7tm Odorant receptor
MKTMKTLTEKSEDLVKENCLVDAQNNQKLLKKLILTYYLLQVFNILSITYTLSLTHQDFTSYHRFFFDQSYLPVKIITSVTSLVAASLAGIATLTVQTCYFSFCLSVATLYRNLRRQIMKLTFLKNEEAGDIIKKSVEMHVRIIETIDLIYKQFYEMLAWDFITYIGVMGLIFFNASSTIAFWRMTLYLPTTLFGMMIFCYGSWLITSAGEKLAVQLYADVEWYTMELKHQKSILIMMVQFQKPIHIKLLGLKQINMELLTVVSIKLRRFKFISEFLITDDQHRLLSFQHNAHFEQKVKYFECRRFSGVRV